MHLGVAGNLGRLWGAQEMIEGQENGLSVGTGMQPFCAVLQQRKLAKKT